MHSVAGRQHTRIPVNLDATWVNAAVTALLDRTGGIATTAQLLTVMTRQQLDVQVRRGGLVRVWYGVYSRAMPDLVGRLAALDVFMGQWAVASMGTAAALYGFDTENTAAIHVLDPGIRLRSTVGLVVHQRIGAPVQWVAGRPATSPAWTAVEVARQLNRPRALATLDAALHSQWCTPGNLDQAVIAQRGRRGIRAVRDLLPFADARSESAMESEARLVMIDHGLPAPELQYTISAPGGQRWRVDFAWPEARIAAEYESIEWHAGRAEMLRDKARFAGVQELGWTVIPIVADDVRRRPARLAERIAIHLARAA
ncbi:hypothetical protein [Mycolicibacterium pallens]|uniref:hypothetical protein n=1 Tax=Mycolicibacterium pallens TaxID=370524 RepID=UPI000AE3B641|nr:hypothetical protein [Mycolicibacterium pallens]